ncbi:hypothetical protein [Halococcus saccharolyticus]|uniref:Uncharacterized protein n=1 Tax=Halococcus saccharolyticus DSM 5350 TaxID=1227455 RepID=M0MQR2_9EURY|nr:hypothetical protein [Halococcus saccharolyticus]EMA47966.1 hypothetical protein C449_00800 [Halococcus saccharolyticus DSM 5350]
MPESRDGSLNESRHEEIEIVNQRWKWQVVASALRALLEDEEADRLLQADAEPVLRTIENGLELDEDERTTETFDD